MRWIARRIIRWTIALWLILVDPAGSVHAATHVLAQFSSVADADLMRIPAASGVAGTLETVQSLPAPRVYAARPSQALVSSWDTNFPFN